MINCLAEAYLFDPLKTTKQAVKPHANGRNVGCCMLRLFAYSVACCCMLLRVVGSCCQKFETGKTFEPRTPNISLVPWSPNRSAIMLHSSPNIVGVTKKAHYTWSPWRQQSNNFAWQTNTCDGPTLLGVVASVCTPLSTRTQQLPTLFVESCFIHLQTTINTDATTPSTVCWELLRPFARSIL